MVNTYVYIQCTDKMRLTYWRLTRKTVASKKVSEKQPCKITALKTRHRSIGTTLTMPKKSVQHPEVKLYNFNNYFVKQ